MAPRLGVGLQKGLHWATVKEVGCSGDLVSRLNSGPYGASYGLLWELVEDTSWTY